MKCKKCGSGALMKNGKRKGQQCYLCKDCRHQFISEFGRHSKADIFKALSLRFGFIPLPYRTIARYFNVSDTTIMRWERRYGREYFERLQRGEEVASGSNVLTNILMSGSIYKK